MVVLVLQTVSMFSNNGTPAVSQESFTGLKNMANPVNRVI